MNKIAQYLNEHILGEAISSESVREKFSRDGSILSITPEIIVHPRVTNDIRKIARFAWQLAEKGHIMPITVRGGGTDRTGAAINKGIIINTVAHLNKILYVNDHGKDQFVHVQPGTNFDLINSTLQASDLFLPAPSSSAFSTIGGAIANNAGGAASGRYGAIGDHVDRLEVVLANGDIIETGRINKRELSKKKGLQTFEGELYRKIDNLIDDNQATIVDKINDYKDNAGYPGISKVKNRDGSFDLTPLFVGNQGTLGIISEAVLKPDMFGNEESIIVASFDDAKSARDVADQIFTLNPSVLEVIDGNLFNMARDLGKKYPFNKKNESIGSIVYISFDDVNERARRRSTKNAMKKLSKQNTTIFNSENYSNDELKSVREVGAFIMQNIKKEESVLSIIDGSSIPATRMEEFIIASNEFANKHHIDLPFQINWLNGVVHTYPILNLHLVSDKQKVFKLMNDYFELIMKTGGNMIAESGEGRLKASAAYAQLDKETIELYAQIKTIFDPYNILNPGVKQENDIKTLVAQLDGTHDSNCYAKYSPNN